VGHTDFIVSLAFVPPGATTALQGPGLVSGSRDAAVVLWDVEHCSALQELKGHVHSVSAVGVLPGGELASGGLDGKLIVWKAGKAVRTLDAHEKPILSLLVLPNGDILTGLKRLGWKAEGGEVAARQVYWWRRARSTLRRRSGGRCWTPLARTR